MKALAAGTAREGDGVVGVGRGRSRWGTTMDRVLMVGGGGCGFCCDGGSSIP